MSATVFLKHVQFIFFLHSLITTYVTYVTIILKKRYTYFYTNITPIQDGRHTTNIVQAIVLYPIE